jgi:MFS transporter, ACS family, solute carrier family 17 (sodium-dependent inorganic phosphate cotransporter), other
MVLLCFFSIFICYIDRVNISVAIIPMAKQFGWTDTQRGLVLSSFFAGYMITQLLGGSLAARFGGKAVLGFGVLWWSLFTLLTPLSAMTSFPILIATRIAMGVGEGVAFPATYNLLGRWVPALERSRSAAFTLSGISMGTLFAVTLTPWVVVTYGWPAIFYLFGAFGFIWFAFWWRLAGDRPALAVDDVPGKAEISARTPWRSILSHMPVWAIIVAHFCNNWGLYVLLSWLPSYFSSQLGVNLGAVWLYVAPPWIANFLGSNLAGWLADRMIARGASVTRVRKLMQTVGFAGPAAALITLASVNDAVTAVILLTITLGLCGGSFAGFASNHLDISPQHAGVIFGISNTAASIPGIIGVALTGYLVDLSGSFATAFYVTAGVYLFGLLVYLLFGTSKRLI